MGFTEENNIDWTPYVGIADYLPNPVFSTLLQLRNKIILLCTGNREGKTKKIVRAKAIYPAIGTCPISEHNIKPHDKCRIIRFGAELLPEDKDNEVRNTVYPQLKYQLPSTMIKKDITARSPVITYQPVLGGKTAQFEFVSYGQSAQSQAGVDRRTILADEVCPYEFYEESMPRLATTNGQFIVGTTPVEAGWMYTEIYERAKMYIRTPAVRAFLKKQYGQTVKQVEKTDSKKDICVIQAASDDNPIWSLMIDQKKKEIKEGIIRIDDFPYDTVSEYLDSVFMYDDPDTVAMRRYGIFRQITGAVHKEFQWNLHMINLHKYFIDGHLPEKWKFARSIDYHQSVPWAIIWATLSEDDELFIWEEMNPDPNNYTTGGICIEMLEKSLDYSYRINLIDKLANETQPNVVTVNRTTTMEINSFFREKGKLSWSGDTAFEAWDDKTTTGENRVRERLINSKICGKPFNNLQKINGREQRLPTLWISDKCKNMGLSLKNWKMEEWIDRDAIITKDPKDKKEKKWSHFNCALECLLKDSRFKVSNFNYIQREERFTHKQYFQGAAR
jgi:hypothetical protein